MAFHEGRLESSRFVFVLVDHAISKTYGRSNRYQSTPAELELLLVDRRCVVVVNVTQFRAEGADVVSEGVLQNVQNFLQLSLGGSYVFNR